MVTVVVIHYLKMIVINYEIVTVISFETGKVSVTEILSMIIMIVTVISFETVKVFLIVSMINFSL